MIPLILFALLAGSTPAAAPVQRFTLIIGANSGGAGRPQLQYAVSDAERVARVLVDLGGVTPANEIVLKQPRLRDLIERWTCSRAWSTPAGPPEGDVLRSSSITPVTPTSRAC